MSRAARSFVISLVVCATLVFGARVACGEEFTIAPDAPPVHVHSPATCHTEGGTDLHIPPSFVVPEATWSAFDIEMRRLQDAETRLAVENKTLKALTHRSTMGTLGYVGLGLLVGAAAGFVAGALVL